MTKFNVTRFGLALGVAAAIALSAPARAGDIIKCQKTIENKASAFQAALLKTLYWSSDALRKGPIDIALAGKIEKKLAGFYGSTKTVDKFRTAIGGLYPATCGDNELSALGFMLSVGPAPLTPLGPAPGTSGIKFTEDLLLVKAENDAFNMMLAEAPLFLNQLQQLQIAAGCPTSSYPNLCGLKSECSERTCMLGDTGTSTSISHTKSWALGSTATSTLSVANVMGMCFMDGDMTGMETGFMYIIGQQGRNLGLINLGGGIWVCVDTLRAAGFCDCGGTGAARKNIVDCMDRDILRPTSGPYTAKCPLGLADLGTDQCGSACLAGQADPNYLGNYNGLPHYTVSGPTTAGDCVDMVTNQFTVITNAYYGTDNKPCTADDTGGVNSPTTVVLTTGSSQATLWNAIKPVSPTDLGYGWCDADVAGTCVGGVNIGNPCRFDSDCPASTCDLLTKQGTQCVSACQNRCLPGPNGFCEVAFSPTACSKKAPCDTGCSPVNYDPVNPNSTLVFTGTKPPAGSFPFASGCELYRQNHLTGLKLVGSFPGSSSAAAAGLGDTLSDFNQDCK